MIVALSVGARVRILPPFDAISADVVEVTAVQFVAVDGSISEAPTDVVQYILGDLGAFASAYVSEVSE